MAYTLTGKYSEITELVYKYRFIDRIQIQKVLNHKGPRRINSWLKDLTEAEFLGRIYSNKLLENTKPAIYYLSYKGISYIKEKHEFNVTEVKKFYEDKNRSQTFIKHCVDVGKLLFSLKKYDNEDRNYEIFSKEQLLRHEYLNEIKPDGFIQVYERKTKKSKEKTISNRYILELIDPGVPRYVIRGRINQYIEYHQEETWKDFITEFPSIFLIFPTVQKQRQFAKYIKTQLEEGLFTQGMVFFLSSYELAMEKGLTNGIWQEVNEEE